MVVKKGSEGKKAVQYKQLVEELGEKLGFLTRFEIIGNLANVKFDNEYRPEVDAAWFFDLTKQIKLKELNTILQIISGLDLDHIRNIPLVGFEIEASDVTSKGQICNAANLFVQHYPYGFLLVDENIGNKDLYRRAAKILRTLRYQYGHKDYFPLSVSQLVELSNKTFIKRSHREMKNQKIFNAKGSGGEKKETIKLRNYLIEKGKIAGFEVYTDWVPSDLEYEYNSKLAMLKEMQTASDLTKRTLGKEISWTPNLSKTISRWDKYFIKPKLDVVWCIRLPSVFSDFMNLVINLDNDFITNLKLLRDPAKPFPIFAFEIESSSNKHAGGGILNLSRYSLFGFVAVPKRHEKPIKGKIYTMSRNMGINNVYPLKWEDIIG